MPHTSPTLIELLRSTLTRLEETEGLDPNDPRVVEFKNSILRSIAELELRKSEAARESLGLDQTPA
jgi:hypothetical protein